MTTLDTFDLQTYFLQQPMPRLRLFPFYDQSNTLQLCSVDILALKDQWAILLSQPGCSETCIYNHFAKVAHTLYMLLAIQEILDDPAKIKWYGLGLPINQLYGEEEDMNLVMIDLVWQETRFAERGLQSIALDKSPFDFSAFVAARAHLKQKLAQQLKGKNSA